MRNEKEKKNRELKLSLVTLVPLLVLLALLLLEFLVAQLTIPRGIIYFFVILQAGFILWDYMHLSRFFLDSGDEEQ